MGKYLRDIVLCGSKDIPSRIEFNLQTNFLEKLYLANLPRVYTNGISKIIVEACSDISVAKEQKMLDVLQISKVFDFKKYFAVEDEEKKRIALDFLQSGLLGVATMLGWDDEPFHLAYTQILSKKLLYEGNWGKPLSSPGKKYKAQIWCRYDLGKADIYVEFLKGKQKICHEFIKSVQPGDVFINAVIGRLEWLSENELKITSRDKNNFGVFRCPT